MAATDMEVVETTAPAAVTVDENSEKHAAINKAADLLAEGKKNILCGDLPTAVNKCEEAVQLLVKSCGELSRDCADAYFYCGSALLELGRMESEVLGVALEGVEVEEEKEVESSEQFEKPPEDESETRIKLRGQIYDAMAEGEREEADQVSNLKPISALSENNLTDATSGDAIVISENKENADQLLNSTVKSEEDSKAEHAESDKSNEAEKNATKDFEPVTKNGKGSEGHEKVKNNSVDGAEQMDRGDQAHNGESNTDKSKADIENDADDVDMAEDEDLETEGSSDDETAAENGEKAEDIPNFQLAWEYLDLAKVLFLKSGLAEDELKAAECYVKLGELSIETEKYKTAAEDLHNALKIQQKLLPVNDRKIAESYYQLGLAYHHGGEYVQSLHHYTQAIHVIESKIESLSALIKEKETNDDNKENEEVDLNKKYQDEIKELQNLIPEIKDKIEDTNEEAKNVEQMKQIAKEALGLTNNVETSSIVGEKDVHVNGEEQPTDIGHLVRKKRKPEDDPEDASSQEIKKSRSELTENLGTTVLVDSGCTQSSTELNSTTNSTEPEEASAKTVNGTECPKEVKEQESPMAVEQKLVSDVTSDVNPEAMEVALVVNPEEEGVISAVTDTAGSTCKSGAKDASNNEPVDRIVAKVAEPVESDCVNVTPVVESESINVIPGVSESADMPVKSECVSVTPVVSESVMPVESECVSDSPVVSESVSLVVESVSVSDTPIVSESVVVAVESKSANDTPVVSESVVVAVESKSANDTPVVSESVVVAVESKSANDTPVVSESVAPIAESESVVVQVAESENVCSTSVESERVSDTPVVSESVVATVESECVTVAPVVSESVVTTVESECVTVTPVVSESVVTPIESDSVDLTPVCEISTNVTSVEPPSVVSPVKSDSADVKPIVEVVCAISQICESNNISVIPVVTPETAIIPDSRSENADLTSVAGPESITLVVPPESSNFAPIVDGAKLEDSGLVGGSALAIEPMATAESANTGSVVGTVADPVLSVRDIKPDELTSVEPVVRNEPTLTESSSHPAHVVASVSEVKSNESCLEPMDVGHDGTASSDSTDVEPMDTCGDVATSSIEPPVSAEIVPVS